MEEFNKSFEDLKEEYKKMCDFFKIPSDDQKAKSTEDFFKFWAGFFDTLNKSLPPEKKKSRMADAREHNAKASEKEVKKQPVPENVRLANEQIKAILNKANK